MGFRVQRRRRGAEPAPAVEPDTDEVSIPEAVAEEPAPQARGVRVKVGTTGNRKMGMLFTGVGGILLAAGLSKFGVPETVIESAMMGIAALVSAVAGANGIEHLADALGKRRV